jgi:hypothetical protein
MKDERRFTKGRQHQLIEQFSIEKPWVWLTRSGSIPRLLGVARNGDLLPHLKTYLKVFGDLAQITPELIRGRWAVERRIVPHGSEQWFPLVLILAILPEAFPSKRALGVPQLIDLALPAFVGPGGGAEPDQRGE